MKNSKLLSLNSRDFLHGLFMAVGGTVVTAIYKVVQIGSFPCTWADWKPIVLAGLGSGLLYLTKKIFNNSEGDFKREGNNL